MNYFFINYAIYSLIFDAFKNISRGYSAKCQKELVSWTVHDLRVELTLTGFWLTSTIFSDNSKIFPEWVGILPNQINWAPISFLFFLLYFTFSKMLYQWPYLWPWPMCASHRLSSGVCCECKEGADLRKCHF